MGTGRRRRSYRRSGKLATGAQRTRTFSERTAGKFWPHGASRADEYGPWGQSRRIQTDRASDGRDPDRERCRVGSYSDRDPGPGVGADGGTRPRHSRVRETALDTVRWRAGSKRAAHSGAAPARPNVRSASERSALPKTRIGRAERSEVGKGVPTKRVLLCAAAQ